MQLAARVLSGLEYGGTTSAWLDPTRVLIVRNSNPTFSTLSRDVANWYAQARGLNGGAGDYGWIEADFGDGSQRLLTQRFVAAGFAAGTGIVMNSPTAPMLCTGLSSRFERPDLVGQPIFAALAALYAQHGIQAVLVTPGIQTNATGPFAEDANRPTDDPNRLIRGPVERVLADAAIYNALPAGSERVVLSERSAAISAGPLTIDYLNPASGISGARRPLPRSRDLRARVPMWGRIGWADWKRSPEAYSTLAQVQAMVDAARDVEQEVNLSAPHVVGGTAYAFQGGESVAVNYAARDLGLRNFGHIATPPEYAQTLDSQPPTFGEPGFPAPGNDSFDLWMSKPAWATQPAAQLYTTSAFAQTIEAVGGGVARPFGLISPRLAPSYRGAAGVEAAARLQFARGGWAYSWMSDGIELALFALNNGGSLAFLPTWEPFNNGVPDMDSVLALLLDGRPGCEVMYRATADTAFEVQPFAPSINNRYYRYGTANIVCTTWGDPLYAPFRMTGANP